ncbi:MAG: winged helix DNA-binding domain-containing protein [Cellulomonas sp.]|nr:winged helix DNA-binding domain-containing protein [Cellulomonas sp.]
MTTPRLTISQARRIALRAQGLDAPRPQRPNLTGRHLEQVVARTGLLQIDSVNVFARAHLMPAFSRLGPYDPALLQTASGRAPRRLVEAWAHEASFVPPSTYRLLGWRHRDHERQAWGSIRSVVHEHPEAVREVRALLTDRGAQTGAQVHAELAAEHPRPVPQEWGWNWTVAKRALEYLFFTGAVTSAGRTASFERRYDLVERVLPPAVLAAPEPTDADALRELLAIAARAHGVGSLRCLADYFRMGSARARPAAAELVEDGVLEQVEVAGWGPAYRHVEARPGRRAAGSALLSPFDPLVFERRRLEELFGLRYRIEIYTPAPRRIWGYYALPFLLGEQIAALVDLKADRAAGLLRVAAAHRAPVVAAAGGPLPESVVVEALADELLLAARWQHLGGVVVAEVGDLHEPLRRRLAALGA